MKRRGLTAAFGAAALGSAFGGARAQPRTPAQPRLVGVLTASTPDAFALSALRDGLRDRGQVEGRDIAMALRYAGGRAEDLPRPAAQLAALKPVVIVATDTAATDAALAAAPGSSRSATWSQATTRRRSRVREAT